jgi:hypothetical protein
MYLFDNFELK